ncbi:MAG: MBL fold metallo-hydrolase [Candidatus Dependentiae bacterium]|nr:MBL fold metallo-hydrolase [Candidatus Dependentiae bacterium]
MKITFLGAAREVTGSKYLIEHEDTKILVDCGLHQGDESIENRNRQAFPIDPSSIDAVVLTHGHIDHSGYIPMLVKKGFTGKIYCSRATYALVAILLKDSGFVQEQNAKRALDEGKGHLAAATALYTVQDAEKSLTFFESVDYEEAFSIGSLQVHLIQSFHILGSSFVIVSDGKETLSFSGDLGRPSQLIMQSPPGLKQTDFLVLESTYGDKQHPQDDSLKELAQAVNEVEEKRGVLIIPAFAVERTQLILYCLYQLRQKNIIPEIPIFLDSPMATKVTQLVCVFKDEHKVSSELCSNAFNIATYISTVEQSKSLDHIVGPAIIIAGSGMADGGRVLHHFKHFIYDEKNTILFVGFQAEGTNGRALVEGAEKIKIDDRWYMVYATIKIINSLSAHADSAEILQWLTSLQTSPKKVFLTHGELQASQALKKKIEDRFGWSVVIPKYLESFDLD